MFGVESSMQQSIKKHTVKALSLLLGVLLFFMDGCTTNKTLVQEQSNAEQTGILSVPDSAAHSLISDPTFSKGLLLQGNNTSSPQTNHFLFPFGKSKKGEPDWKLSEWASKYPLDRQELKKRNKKKIYENEGKLLSIERQAKTTTIQMKVKASAEYDHARKEGEPWPHLLLEQQFKYAPQIDEMKDLRLSFEGRLTDAQSSMTEENFNPNLHSAQFQLYLVIQNKNKASEDYGDFLWFGVPFYDYRYRTISLYAEGDIGKGDATGKFIYSIASDNYTEGSFQDGKWVTADLDLQPLILKAFALAQDRGYLKGSELQDMAVTGMNLGWEVSGTFDVGFEFRNFDLTYSLKANNDKP